jgi:hypothetical protein
MSITTPMGIPNKRAGIVYFLALLETTFLTLLVFAKPIYDRIELGIWQRYNITLEWTLSLDLHVILASTLTLLFLFQGILIFIQKPGQISKLFSRFYSIIILFSLLFCIDASWNVYLRISTLERQMVFYFLLIFVEIFLIRGYLGLKNNDYMKFLDSFIGAFILMGVAAIFRLLVPIYILTFGLPSWTQNFQNQLLLSAGVLIYLKLFLIYAIAGRLQQNTLIVFLQAYAIILIFAFLPCPSN